MKTIPNIFYGILVFVAIVAIIPSAMAANQFYYIPTNSTVSCSDNATVQLWVDYDVNVGGHSEEILYDNTIVNISNVVQVEPGLFNWVWYNDHIFVSTLFASTLNGPGSTHIANITVDCKGVDGISYLNFDKTKLSTPAPAQPINHIVINGTVNCTCPSQPDLIVTSIEPTKELFKGLTNVITVHVKNQDNGDTIYPFDVRLNWTTDNITYYIIDTKSTGPLPGLGDTIVKFNWKPTEPTTSNITLKATVDCFDAIPESNETNNDPPRTYMGSSGDCSKDGYLEGSCYGYRGNQPLEMFEDGIIAGDLLYTFGDSKYLSGYWNKNWTAYKANFTFPCFDNISMVDEDIEGPVKEARLYVYYNTYKYPKGGRLPNVTSYLALDFNAGINIPVDKHYEDSKGFGTSSYRTYKYGTIVYNVTNYVDEVDKYYDAVLHNSEPQDGNTVSMYGMALLVAYEDSSVNPKQYCIFEGYDQLKTKYSNQYEVVPEDATCIFDMCPFSGGDAEFFTVTTDMADGAGYSRLYFNPEWDAPWTMGHLTTMGTFTDLVPLSPPNTVKFQDRGDGFSATNAILIKNQGSKIDLGPNQITEEGRQITIPITAYDVGQFYGAVEMNLSYNPAKFQFVRVDSTPDSIVYAYNYYPSVGIVDISAMNDDGIKGNIILAEVVFDVIGGKGTCSEFNLTVDLLRDIYYANIPNYDVPTEICIEDPAGLKVNWATAHPQGLLGGAILNTNGRPRHSGDDEVLIKANILDSGLGIQDVRVDLTSIGGGSNVHMTGPYPNAGNYQYIATADDGIDALHDFIVTAEDNGGNLAHNTTNSFYVWRRGDTVKDNVVNIIDAYNIAQYTVGLFTPPTPAEQNRFDFRGDVQPANDSDYTTNMVDALYIARHGLTLEPAP